MNIGVKNERAMFGAGCFWGVEHAFRQMDGVLETSVGYSGGHVNGANYKEVCSGETGHAEVVLIRFDPSRIGYEELVKAFFALHDPTQLNRQGPDVGTQYRSAVFYFDEKQRELAQVTKEALQPAFNNNIVTEVTVAGPFWEAEEYHQQYLEKKGVSSCRI
ncbi:peptide-methionine (S)-S-oxide reductase MsrA [Curvivirga aplysinae]|uniref:peptide-methionine (S)-S-oxide reductase MsrA n=1 Tax=Curvivirga aplysinae TaxID=2529852 RepID=UPI0012BBFA19|nr:peptide-methionine (S)-S-oxide reductase MsrA [Curvivirga aplysinae]MTI09135.1 peptide-methionine (S)-S-oxide reductase [Curvivirga aplysinae]